MASELEQLFQLAGCNDPEGWARSEIEENIPQLSRYLFLRMMLEGVVEEGSGQKMANVWRHNDLGSGASKRLIKSGADPQDLADLVRAEQMSLVRHIAYRLWAPDLGAEFEDYGWTLVAKQGREIGGLEESINEIEAELCSNPSHQHF